MLSKPWKLLRINKIYHQVLYSLWHPFAVFFTLIFSRIA